MTDGVVALEFVLSFRSCIALIFAIASFGLYFSEKVDVTGAARDAARTLALRGTPDYQGFTPSSVVTCSCGRHHQQRFSHPHHQLHLLHPVHPTRHQVDHSSRDNAMRRLSQPDDRGVATIFVVLAMPVLLLCGAFVFDGGRGIVARRETQNAADAGALAKATDCVKAVATTDFTPYQTNGTALANTPTCGSDTTTVSMKPNHRAHVLRSASVRGS